MTGVLIRARPVEDADPCSVSADLAPAAPSGAVPWAAGLYADVLRADGGSLFLRRGDGRLQPLDIDRWLARADRSDMAVLGRCTGAVLDIGCGPGRCVTALTKAGRTALGIDVCPTAVARTVLSGGAALCRSVFEPVPCEGRWGTALLMDGNIGIGGDPKALLERIAHIVGPGGQLLAETASTDADERHQVRIEDADGAVSPVFHWATIGTPALLRRAKAAGWNAVEQWTHSGRNFVALRRG